jgi:predicted nucleic acid-binding protein
VVRPRRRLRTRGIPDGIVLDSGAISAALDGAFSVRAELTVAEQIGIPVHVSAVTLTEVMRGHRRDMLVRSLLRRVNHEPVTAEIGQAAGELLGRTGRSDTVDAIVAVTAERAGKRVRLLTGDADDLLALTDAMSGVVVVAI